MTPFPFLVEIVMQFSVDLTAIVIHMEAWYTRVMNELKHSLDLAIYHILVSPNVCTGNTVNFVAGVLYERNETPDGNIVSINVGLLFCLHEFQYLA